MKITGKYPPSAINSFYPGWNSKKLAMHAIERRLIQPYVDKFMCKIRPQTTKKIWVSVNKSLNL
jgi:hypothetical protein